MDGNLERFNLKTFRQSLTRLDKLNQDIFTLTFGKKNVPPMALKLSKKKKRLKYKQYRRGLRDDGDASLAVMGLTEASFSTSFSNLEYPANDIPTIAEFLESPLAKYITLAANDCGYSGTAEELIVSYVHPLFLPGGTRSGWPAHIGLTWRNQSLLVRPAQQDYTWRNQSLLVRPAQQDYIVSLSVCLSVCA